MVLIVSSAFINFLTNNIYDWCNIWFNIYKSVDVVLLSVFIKYNLYTVSIDGGLLDSICHIKQLWQILVQVTGDLELNVFIYSLYTNTTVYNSINYITLLYY